MNKPKFTFYNSDGSLTSEYRERLKQKGASEAEINRIEEVNVRHTRVEKEQAYWKAQHQKHIEEWRRKREAEKAEQ